MVRITSKRGEKSFLVWGEERANKLTGATDTNLANLNLLRKVARGV